MVHSFALQKVKGKEGESVCKLASGPIAKFISQMQGMEPCTPASKTKGKPVTSDYGQLHKESRGPRGVAKASALLLMSPWPAVFRLVICPSIRRWTPPSGNPGAVNPTAGLLRWGGSEQSLLSAVAGTQLEFYRISKDNTQVSQETRN